MYLDLLPSEVERGSDGREGGIKKECRREGGMDGARRGGMKRRCGQVRLCPGAEGNKREEVGMEEGDRMGGKGDERTQERGRKEGEG